MKLGTRSLLFGVHQFLWHPWTVARAWHARYGKWPSFYEWCAIFLHDVGYWECPNMDGEQGKLHPTLGAQYIYQLVEWCETWRGNAWWSLAVVEKAMSYFELVLYHSRSLAQMHDAQPSALCLPDKDSILFDPLWFYWLRGCASGEIFEYRDNAVKGGYLPAGVSTWAWLKWYHARIASASQNFNAEKPTS